MSCKDAMISTVVTVSPEITVAEALDILRKNSIRVVPVVEDGNVLVGMFGSRDILQELLPVSVTMEDGLERIDFVIGASPGVAKRLVAIKHEKVAVIMRRDQVKVEPETSLWEGTRLLVKHGSPLPVVDPETGKLLGIISEQSAIEGLERSLEDLKKENSGE